jgi:hypothetical protein
MTHHIHPLENCLARILVIGTDLQPLPSGTGVALHGGRVLTCAHVVNTALKLSRDSKKKPEEIITLDFPLSGSIEKVTAKVGFWDAETDLAELQIIETLPSEVIPTFLLMPDELWDHRIQAFGFPNKNLEGTWADCQLRGHNIRGWVELFDPNTTGNFIKQGFSGGPVWDSTLKCVIGIIVAVERNDDSRVGYLIPAHLIAEKWSDLPVHHQKPKPKQNRIPRELLPYLVDRRKQEEDLRKLYKMNNPQSPLPMVAIIYGDHQQAHDTFLERLKNEFIPRLLNSNPPIERIQLEWPTYMNNLADLGGKFTQELAKKFSCPPESKCEDVQRIIASYECPAIIQMELLTDDWLRHRQGVLDSILDFWNNWPPLTPRQQLFVVLYVTHKTPGTWWLNRFKHLRVLRQIIGCPFNRYPRIHALSISELADISESDVRNWARMAAEELDSDIIILLSRISELFKDGRSKPMGPLLQDLKEILAATSGD